MIIVASDNVPVRSILITISGVTTLSLNFDSSLEKAGENAPLRISIRILSLREEEVSSLISSRQLFPVSNRWKIDV